MNDSTAIDTGSQKIVEYYRAMFRIPENTGYYSNKDYKNAERQFLKFALSLGFRAEGPPQQ